MAATIQDLTALGFTVDYAHGSVEVEEQALADAKAAADPNVVAEQVNKLTTDTVQTLASIGKLPDTPEERHELAVRIADDALAMLTEAVSEKVAFHERAVQIAKESPDVWVVQHVVDDMLVAQLYIACKEDGTGWDADGQAQLDALADPACFDERVFQAQNPDAMQAAQQLSAAGKTVSRDLGSSTFTVDGKPLTATKTVEAAAALPAKP